MDDTIKALASNRKWMRTIVDAAERDEAARVYVATTGTKKEKRQAAEEAVREYQRTGESITGPAIIRDVQPQVNDHIVEELICDRNWLPTVRDVDERRIAAATYLNSTGAEARRYAFARAELDAQTRSAWS